MKHGNVLVLGNSGVGKSTLINAVLGEDRAETGYGTKGTTSELGIFESDRINFRLIDSIGFEPDFFKRRKAIKAVQDWSKIAAKAGDPNSAINVVWFCVEGTSSKLFPQEIETLCKAVSVFRTVPIIVVITKSYSQPDREKNIQMVGAAFARYSKKLNLCKVIPVVAEMYKLNDTAFAPSEGIVELIEATNSLMPEGIEAAKNAISDFELDRKNAFARNIIGASTAGGVVVGAVNILPMTDAAILSTIELAEVDALARVYGIKKSNDAQSLIRHIVEFGTVSVVARAACAAVLKVIPVAGNIANAAVAGSFVAAIGEGTRYIFEQIYLGNQSITDFEWVEEILNEKLSKGFAEKVKKAADSLSDKSSKEDIIAAVRDVFRK